MHSPQETDTIRGQLRGREKPGNRSIAGVWPWRAARGAGKTGQLVGLGAARAGRGPSISYMEGPCRCLPPPRPAAQRLLTIC